MSKAKKLIEPVQLGAAASILLTAKENMLTLVGKVDLFNVDTTNAVVATIYLVPKDGALSDANTILVKSVAAKATESYVLNQVLKPGDTLRALAGTAAKISIHISGTVDL